MTLRELINSVDSEQYSDSALYQKLRDTKPEYGSNRRIQVKLVNGEVAITNVHVGSLGAKGSDPFAPFCTLRCVFSCRC